MVFIPRLYHISMNCLKPPTRDSCLMFMYPSLEHLELHPRWDVSRSHGVVPTHPIDDHDLALFNPWVSCPDIGHPHFLWRSWRSVCGSEHCQILPISQRAQWQILCWEMWIFPWKYQKTRLVRMYPCKIDLVRIIQPRNSQFYVAAFRRARRSPK